MKKKALNMNEIASRCGVSVSTVSRVLNNAPGISRETRRLVMEAAGEGSFIHRKRRRPLARSGINLVITVPDSQQMEVNPFFDSGELLNAINSAFQKEDKQIEFITYSGLEDWVRGRERRADGFIFAFGEVPERLREKLTGKSIPYMYLNRNPERENYITCNNFRGALELAGHLLARGYRRIGYLGFKGHPVNLERSRGYRMAMMEAGMGYGDELIHEAVRIDGVDDGAAGFFIKQRCDAVMAFNDNFAIRFINAMTGKGKRVPADMAVTGFDNSPLRRLYTPSITTVSLSIYEMGFLAARWLRDNIVNRENRMIRLEVDGLLIEGETVGTVK